MPYASTALDGSRVYFEDDGRGARRTKIPNAEFISLQGLDHIGAHLRPDPVLPAVLRTLRSGG